MFARILVALAVCAVAACAVSTPAPAPAPPVQVVITASVQPFVRTIVDRSMAGGAEFDIALAPSNQVVLDRALEGSAIGITLYLPPASGLWATPLGEEPIAVILHPANPVGDLSLAQLRDIFTGRAQGWTVAVREGGDDSRAAFEASALAGLQPTLLAAVMPSPEAMLRYVADNPDAVGYLPLRWVTGAVKPVTIDSRPPGSDRYALRALVVAVARREPVGDAREWLGRVQDTPSTPSP